MLENFLARRLVPEQNLVVHSAALVRNRNSVRWSLSAAFWCLASRHCTGHWSGRVHGFAVTWTFRGFSEHISEVNTSRNDIALRPMTSHPSHSCHPTQHHITPHDTTSHHITSHHLTLPHVTQTPSPYKTINQSSLHARGQPIWAQVTGGNLPHMYTTVQTPNNVNVCTCQFPIMNQGTMAPQLHTMFQCD